MWPLAFPRMGIACQETKFWIRSAQVLLRPVRYFNWFLLSRKKCALKSAFLQLGRDSCMWAILTELTQSKFPSSRNTYKNKALFSSKFLYLLMKPFPKHSDFFRLLAAIYAFYMPRFHYYQNGHFVYRRPCLLKNPIALQPLKIWVFFCIYWCLFHSRFITFLQQTYKFTQILPEPSCSEILFFLTVTLVCLIIISRPMCFQHL